MPPFPSLDILFVIRMAKLVPITTDEKLALLALLKLSGFSVVDRVSYFSLGISADCVANNFIFKCILKKTAFIALDKH